MDNFIFQNPTKLVFGKGMIAKLAELIPAGKRVMVTFGGGSVKRNGVYDEVASALEGRDMVEFWGIEPNPSIETLREAIALGKENKVDFLLAVGGGSVIDGTKLISADCSTTATRVIWCVKAFRGIPCRWVRCSRFRQRVRR